MLLTERLPLCIEDRNKYMNTPREQNGELPYILESNPHPLYSFRGLKNQMRIRIECGLDSRSRAGFWKNDRAGVLALFRLRRWQKLDAD
jgi:hypothetical protein